MATLVSYGKGRQLRRIEFRLSPSERNPRIIRLGRMPARAARDIEAHVEDIIADKLAHRPHDARTAEWLSGLDDELLARLRRVGLAEGVGIAQTTLEAFLERFFDALVGKPSTRISYGNTRRNLEEHFGKGRLMRDISHAEADAWRAWLVEHEKLAPATIARRVVAARTMWRKAIRWKLVTENVFEGVKGGHQGNESRKRFIPMADIERVLDCCPDAEWRVVVLLSRVAGLRTPSETLALTWRDIDWARGTIHVTCPKMAHHESYAVRTVPLFPRLRGPLLELFEQSDEGADHLIQRYRDSRTNLRTQFERIIRRAGLSPWPKLFHNLRASRESELLREFDLATVCKWLGNSPVVMARHYATSVDLDGDFRRAAGLDEAQRNAQCALPDVPRHGKTEDRPPNAQASESQGDDALCPEMSIPDKDVDWAILGSNQ
jgi:integrase